MIFFPVVYLEDYYHPIYFQKKNMTTFFKTESFSKNNEKKERKKRITFQHVSSVSVKKLHSSSC